MKDFICQMMWEASGKSKSQLRETIQFIRKVFWYFRYQTRDVEIYLDHYLKNSYLGAYHSYYLYSISNKYIEQ